MSEVSDKYLAQMLEGYENNLEGITTAIDQMETQMKNAKENREDMITTISELKEALGVSEELVFDDK